MLAEEDEGGQTWWGRTPIRPAARSCRSLSSSVCRRFSRKSDRAVRWMSRASSRACGRFSIGFRCRLRNSAPTKLFLVAHRISLYGIENLLKDRNQLTNKLLFLYMVCPLFFALSESRNLGTENWKNLVHCAIFHRGPTRPLKVALAAIRNFREISCGAKKKAKLDHTSQPPKFLYKSRICRWGHLKLN